MAGARLQRHVASNGKQICSRSSSYLLHTNIEPPSQKKPQRSTFLVPDFCGNLFDTCLAGLQKMHGALNAQTLEIRHWRFPKDALQPPGKRPFARAYGFRSIVEGKSTCESGTRPALKVLYNRVGVNQVIS